MRYLFALISALAVIAAATIGSPAATSYAAFHCMRIHAVKAGWGGDPNVQYVELRMDIGSQSFVAGHTVQFFDGTMLKATFTFPASVVHASTGDSILIATSDFNGVAQGGIADFTFTNANTVGVNGGDPLHPVQSPNGKVVWAPADLNCSSTAPADSVAAGMTTGMAAANYGSAAVAFPPASDTRALRLGNLNLMPTNNSTEYSLSPVSTTTFSVTNTADLPSDLSTPRNNARTVIKLAAAPVGGIAERPEAAASAPLRAHTAGGGHADVIWYALSAAGALMFAAAGAAVVRRRRAR